MATGAGRAKEIDGGGVMETIYNGVEFRSKLEADFASFLNFKNIKYIYEPETFKIFPDNVIDKQTSYTPDFYLPFFDIYIELKPNKNNDWLREGKQLSAIRQLSKNGKRFFVVRCTTKLSKMNTFIYINGDSTQANSMPFIEAIKGVFEL